MISTQQVQIITTLSGVRDMVGRLDPALPVFFDTETTGYEGSDLRTDLPVALQFHQAGITWIVDIRPASRGGRCTVGEALAPLFEKVVLVGHNLKFDLEVLDIHFDVRPLKCWDTMIAEQVLYGLGLSDGKKQGVGFGLKDCAARRGITVEKDTRGSFKNMHLTPAWDEPFTPEQIAYMAQDVEVLPTIYGDQVDLFVLDAHRMMLVDEAKFPLQACFSLEMEVLPALVHVEDSGVPVDWDAWMSIIHEKEVEAEALRAEVQTAFEEAVTDKRLELIDLQMERLRAWEDAKKLREASLKARWEAYHVEEQLPGWGEYKNGMMKTWREENPRPEKPKTNSVVFNMNSPAQLLEAFKELGIPAEDTTEDTLEDLAEDWPIAGKLLAYRKASKFVQSFGENLRAFVSSADGRLHTDYMQIGASSNRMSCTKPKLLGLYPVMGR